MLGDEDEGSNLDKLTYATGLLLTSPFQLSLINLPARVVIH
jgi:hypothetical protein